MKIIIDEYKREIQKIKMELSEQIEENVRLKGFKQMVMQKPEDFDNDKSFENDTRPNLFDEERLEFRALQNKIKELEGTLAGAQDINDDHQRYNAKLQTELTEVQTELTEVREDNKKLALQIEDMKMNTMRKSGM